MTNLTSGMLGPDSGKQTLPVGDLPRGVYFVRHEASRSVKKLIIQ